jgi:hypothetical protein
MDGLDFGYVANDLQLGFHKQGSRGVGSWNGEGHSGDRENGNRMRDFG